jgi:branched-chain amino acid transport system substrate-binding protein
LNDLIAGFLESVERGETSDREKLLARNPGLEEKLLAFFEQFDRIEKLASPLRKLAGITSLPHPFGTVDHYKLEGVIGEGGMGVVYKAFDLRLKRIVALKMIRTGRLASAEDLHRFHREAQAAAAMNHPNIVPIYDSADYEGQPYFTMRLISGRTLDAAGRDFGSDLRKIALLIAVVSRAIHHAHTRPSPVIHRDLKPGNILVDQDGAPHVTDFGLATVLEARKRATDSEVLGTLPYMSPEQLSVPARTLTTAVDIWGLGAILYELLTGRTPFPGNDEADTMALIRKGTPTPMRALNPAVPRDLEAICLRCLEKDSKDRYDSALALSQDLERWLDKEATRIDRYIREARRTELRHELFYTSRMDADRVLMQLKDWSRAVLEAAGAPDLPPLLERKKSGELQAFLERIRRTFEDPDGEFCPTDERSPFESWVLFDRRGIMIACTPHRTLVGKDFSGREWVRGALDRAGKRGLDSVHVSRVFLSVITKNLCKFALTVPVYAGHEADAPVVGVLGASFTTGSNLGLRGLSDDRRKVVVVGRWDPDSYGGYTPSDYLVLVHPAYHHGDKALKVNTPVLQSFSPKPRKGELRPPEPGQVGVVDEDYEDPLAARDARYEGVWWAGIAPVGNTPFVAIVQRRPDPLIERLAGIPVGLMVDLTGSTSSVSEPYAEGIQAYADWFNAQAGIQGKKVRLVRVDYANKIHEALEIYSRFKTVDRVLAIQGWGTGDSLALTKDVSRDQIPFFSGSYSADLADPRKTPYNFFVGADYSAQLCAGLDYLRERWKQRRNPRIAFVYPNDSYGRSPIPAGRKHARDLGFEIAGEEHVALNEADACRQVRALKRTKPDVVWIGGTTPSTVVVLKEARRQNLRPRFLVNIWGNDEDLLKLAGEEAEGVLGLQASALFGDDVPGMKHVREATGGEAKITPYVRGWVSMMVLCEGLRRAEGNGDLSGPGLKKALETLISFDTQGLMPPVTFTSNDHRPSRSVRVYEYTRGAMRLRATVQRER